MNVGRQGKIRAKRAAKAGGVMPGSSHRPQKTQDDRHVGLFDNRSPSIIAYKKAVLITRFKDVAPAVG